MKVLYITGDVIGTDGWGRYSRDLIAHVSEKIEKVVVVSKIDRSFPPAQHALVHKPLRYLRFPFLALFHSFRIRKLIQQEKPDVVHILAEPYALCIPFLPKSIPYVLTVHGTYAVRSYRRFRTRWLTKKYYSLVTKVISVSDFTKKKLVEVLPSVKEKISVIANGIVITNESCVTPHNDRKIIIFIGAVSARKGVLECLNALAVYKKKVGDNFDFFIIGKVKKDGEYYALLAQAVRNYGLEPNVHFSGLVFESEKREYLQKADAFIMLSQVLPEDHFEGFGLVYLEANAFGVPVIGPNAGGPVEAIVDGSTGFTVDVHDSEEVAEKLRAITHGSVISRQACYDWAKEHDVQKVANEVSVLYESVAALP